MNFLNQILVAQLEEDVSRYAGREMDSAPVKLVSLFQVHIDSLNLV